jgi:RHS repeat-associated protein
LEEVWNGTVTNTLTRNYHPDGRPNGLTLTSGYQIETTYDATTGHFDTLTYTNTVTSVTHTADYSYLTDSTVIDGYTLGDLERTVTYEPNRNLVDTLTNTWDDTTTLSAFDYTNDDAGRRTGRDDSGTAFASTQANVFAYNSRSEVISATMSNGISSYTFDQIGNRTQISVPDESNPVDYTTNALNQYTSLSLMPSVVPTHDLDGNLTHDGEGWYYEWNAENRLTVARDYDPALEDPAAMDDIPDGSIRLTFTYDAQGRRVRKQIEEYDLTSDLFTLTSDTAFFYDGWNLLYEQDLLGTNPTRRYVWGLDLSQSMQGAGGVGGLLLTESNGNSHGITYDANGNISEYIDLADGSIDAHLEYDAFGRTIASTGTAPAPFGFSTKYMDEETNFYYYGFRYYDPEKGRWPNRDPIGENGGINLYGYVENAPSIKIDILGLSSGKNCCDDKQQDIQDEITRMANEAWKKTSEIKNGQIGMALA